MNNLTSQDLDLLRAMQISLPEDIAAPPPSAMQREAADEEALIPSEPHACAEHYRKLGFQVHRTRSYGDRAPAYFIAVEHYRDLDLVYQRQRQMLDSREWLLGFQTRRISELSAQLGQREPGRLLMTESQRNRTLVRIAWTLGALLMVAVGAAVAGWVR